MRSTVRFGALVASLLAVPGAASAENGAPALARVEARALAADVVTSGTARPALPRSVSIVPSALKAKPGLITTLPSRNARLGEGDVLLTASGRPVFIFLGTIPTYRDLVPGASGDDVRQLEEALARLGFDPGPRDGTFDRKTGAAVAAWYTKAGWEPFGPTVAQLANLRTLEEGSGTAAKAKLAAANAAAGAAHAVASAKATAQQAGSAAAADVAAKAAARETARADLANATLAVEAARATADHRRKVAMADRTAKMALRKRMVPSTANGTPLIVETARAKAEHAIKATQATVAAKLADRALVAMDPRSTRTAKAVAEANLELARAAAAKVKLEEEVAVETAEREANLMAQQLELAEAAVKAAELEGEVAIRAALNAQKAARRNVALAERQLALARSAAKIKGSDAEAAVRAAIDAQKIAELDLKLATEHAARVAGDLEAARSRSGIQVPADEIVFLPALPVRVEQATVLVGDPASGPVIAMSDGQVMVDTSVPLDMARFVRPGTKVAIEQSEVGIKATGVVEQVADSPGIRGVEPNEVYVSVRVDEAAGPLAASSLRLRIPVGSDVRKVTAVPVGAVDRAADGTSSVQVRSDDGALVRVPVKPGLAADGFVEVTPLRGTLSAGQLVVVGSKDAAPGEKR